MLACRAVPPIHSVFTVISLIFSFVEPGVAQASHPNAIQGLEYQTGKVREFSTRKADLKTVVVFLSTRCPCSARHREGLNQLVLKYSGQGFQFVGIHSNQNETEEEGKSTFTPTLYSFPVLRDKKALIAEHLGAIKTPHAFILGTQPEPLFEGGVSNSVDPERATEFFLENALADLAQGNPVSRKQARALGCMISK